METQKMDINKLDPNFLTVCEEFKENLSKTTDSDEIDNLTHDLGFYILNDAPHELFWELLYDEDTPKAAVPSPFHQLMAFATKPYIGYDIRASYDFPQGDPNRDIYGFTLIKED